MSATYIHYMPPSSLPSDYSILSHYNAQHEPHDQTRAQATSQVVQDEGPSAPYGAVSIPSRGRRSTFSHGPRNTNPNLRQLEAASSGAAWGTSTPAVPSENDPLLLQVPRINEEHDVVDDSPNMFWEEAVILLRYSLPVFGTHLFEYSLQVASVVSIGHLSTTALAAATLASMTASVTGFSIAQGLTSALDTLLPSAWTSGHPEFVGLWAQRMGVVILATLVPIIVLWFNAEGLLLLLGQEAEVASLAALYLKWMSLGMPAYGLNCVIRRYFQSQGLFDVPTRIIVIVAPINALLNYLLVWGPAPFRLGYIGAPIATGLSYNLITIMYIAYGVWFAPDHSAWHPISRRSVQSLGLVVSLGLAGVGQIASEWWSWELVALAASQLGPIALAAQSILLVSASTTYQAPYAVAVAASVRVGNLLGERNPNRARVASHVSCLFALIIGSMWSAMFLTFRKSWAILFNEDPEVGVVVASILPVVAAFQIFDGAAGVTNGILRARGKQGTGALINLTAYYVIGIPIGLYLAFPLGRDLIGLWQGLTLSLIYASSVSLWIILRTDWPREVRKVLERFEKDRAQTSHV